jgi:hypothetical protein
MSLKPLSSHFSMLAALRTLRILNHGGKTFIVKERISFVEEIFSFYLKKYIFIIK